MEETNIVDELLSTKNGTLCALSSKGFCARFLFESKVRLFRASRSSTFIRQNEDSGSNENGVEMMQPSQIVREGSTLRFWLSGSAESPLVVFTHGAGVDHREWRDTLDVVAKEFRVMCWDVRGHGQSQPEGSPFTLARATEDLLALLDAVGAKKAVLVGHSMGGNIVQEVIFRAPERVQAAVLLGCTSNTQRFSRADRWLASIVLWMMKLCPYKLLLRKSAGMFSTRPEVCAYLREAFEQVSETEFRALIPQLLKDLHEEPGYKIPVPFLLLHGANDNSGNIRKLAPKWAHAEPQCEYTVIPNAGHIANMDNPQVFNQLLLDFLHRLTALQWATRAAQSKFAPTQQPS